MIHKIVTCGFKEDGGISKSINSCKDVVKECVFKHIHEMIEEYSIRPISCDRIVIISTAFRNLIEDVSAIKEFYSSRLEEKGISIVVLSKDSQFAKTFNEMFLEEDDIVCCWFDNLTVLILEEMLTGDMSTLNKKYKAIVGDGGSESISSNNSGMESEFSSFESEKGDDLPDEMFLYTGDEESTESNHDVPFNDENEPEFDTSDLNVDENVSLALSLDLDDELFLSDVEDTKVEDKDVPKDNAIKNAVQDEAVADFMSKAFTDDEDTSVVEGKGIGDLETEVTSDNDLNTDIDESDKELLQDLYTDDNSYKEEDNSENEEEEEPEQIEDHTEIKVNPVHFEHTSVNNEKKVSITSDIKEEKKIPLKPDRKKKQDIADKNESKSEGAKIYRLYPPVEEDVQSGIGKKLSIQADTKAVQQDTYDDTGDESVNDTQNLSNFKELKKLVAKNNTKGARRVFVVTGREGSGVTTVAMMLSYMYNAVTNSKVLYVDMDFRGNDTWLRFGTFNKFGDFNSQGLFSLEMMKLKDCAVNVVSGLDLVTNIDVVNHEKLNLGGIINKILGSHEYEAIIFDIPFSILKYVPDMLYFISENIVVVEGNVGGALKMAHGIDNLEINNKDMFLNRMKVVKNKAKGKFNLKRYFADNVNSVVDLEELYYCKNEIGELDWDYSLDKLLKMDKQGLKNIINLFCELIGV